ncbi:MAG TPA: hypothetical protein VGF30_08195 [Bacteroidia bacterium]
MSKEEKLYTETGQSFKKAEESQMFGKPCFKINTKAFICFFENCMVFKLTGDTHKEALALKGAKLFDPSGKGRAMKEWVQVPYTSKEKWASYAEAALKYVSGK